MSDSTPALEAPSDRELVVAAGGMSFAAHFLLNDVIHGRDDANISNAEVIEYVVDALRTVIIADLVAIGDEDEERSAKLSELLALCSAFVEGWA